MPRPAHRSASPHRTRALPTAVAVGALAATVGCGLAPARARPGSDMVPREPLLGGTTIVGRDRCSSRPVGGDSAYVGRRACRSIPVDSTPSPSGDTGQPPRKTP